MHDNLHPAVVHVVDDIVQRAHRKPVSVCGEMAGNPASDLLLLGLGVDSLSMTPSSLPRVKWTIRGFTIQPASTRSFARIDLPKSENGYAHNRAQDIRVCSTERRREFNHPPDLKN